MSAYNNDHSDEPFPSMGIMQPDETPVWSLSRLLLAGTIVTVILMTWLAALYYQYNSHESAKKIIEPKEMMGATKTLKLVQNEAQASLTAAPHVADKKTGRIAIPIALAEQRVLAELKEKPDADVTGPAPVATPEAEEGTEGESQDGEMPAEEPAAEEKKDADKKEAAEEKPAEEASPEKADKDASDKDAGNKEDGEAKEEAAKEETKEDTSSPEEKGDASTTEEDPSTEPEAPKDE